MHRRNKQGGMTFLGFIIVLAIVVFVVIIGMKLFPVYQEYYSVVGAMNNVAAQPGVGNQTPAQIKVMLDKRLYTSYVETVTQKDMKVTRTKNGLELNVAYEVRKPLIGNLDFIASFDKTVELN